MAELVSLGLSRPCGLSYLINEALLPADPDPSLYSCHTRPSHAALPAQELLYTTECVVWSIDGAVRKVYNFKGQQRKVRQALLATFPRNPSSLHHPDTLPRNASKSHHPSTFSTNDSRSHHLADFSTNDSQSHHPQSLSPSLVIVLATELHIHFLSGSSHVVSLPFDLERAYSAHQGIIVRRKPSSPTEDDIDGPGVPPPPPFPSFASPSHSFSQSTLPMPLSDSDSTALPPHLSALFASIAQNSQSPANINLPVFYSLADSLSDFSPILCASHVQSARTTPGTAPIETVNYDFLDHDEDIIYVSAQDELASTPVPGDLPLLIIVTANSRSRQISIWQSWYLEPHSLSSLLALRAKKKAAKARKRSSFASSSQFAHGMTPASRQRDRPRESYAAASRPTTDFAMSQNSTRSRQPQDDEETMASRMDPDYLPSKQPAKTSRRISSLLSRADVPNTDAPVRQTALGASFGGSGRRGPSVGSFYDRRSVGGNAYRKSRGSTPGSVFSRSAGARDDMTDSSTHLEDDYLDDEYDSIGRLVSATYQSEGADAGFGGIMEGSRRDQITRKLDSIPLHRQAGQSAAPMSGDVKAFPVMQSTVSADGDRRMDIYVLDKMSGQMTVVTYRLRKQAILGSETGSGNLPRKLTVPVIDDRRSVSQVLDMEKVDDGGSGTVLFSTTRGHLMMVHAQGLTCTIAVPRRLRLSNPTDVREQLFELTQREVGRKRTSTLDPGPLLLLNGSKTGHFSISTPSGPLHRLQLVVAPSNATIRQILQVCQSVLHGEESKCLPTLWCRIYHRFMLSKPRRAEGLGPEWEALIVTLFAIAVGSIGRAVKPKNLSDSDLPFADSAAPYDSHMASRSVKSRTRDLPSKSWDWLRSARPQARLSLPSRTKHKRQVSSGTTNGSAVSLAEYEAIARHFLHDAAVDDLAWLASAEGSERRTLCACKIMLALHLFREDAKLDVTFEDHGEGKIAACLAAVVSQFGHWLGFESWDGRSGTYYSLETVPGRWELSPSTMRASNSLLLMLYPRPPSVYEWIERSFSGGSSDEFLTLEQVAAMGRTAYDASSWTSAVSGLLPRLTSLQHLSSRLRRLNAAPHDAVEKFLSHGLSAPVIETLPVSILGPVKEAIIRCQISPSPAWPASLLQFVGRDDLAPLSKQDTTVSRPLKSRIPVGRGPLPARDAQAIFASADRIPVASKTHEAERHAVVSLIFSEDRRLVDALRLMNPTSIQIAECSAQPEWSEVEHLDQQKRVMEWVMVRTIALAPGFAMMHFESQRPLLSEHFTIKGFSTSCQMKPMDNTVSADRTNFTEEKFGWAFFHSGVSAGLTISQNARGIDTSWIVFNKPTELGNRHAGFLLALGINGHLRNLAKWLAFKYLTPKHNMTSIGLLLGLSASYIGTMDALITRMLSVHITRMLPPGAAELNVSPSAQTAGLLGIGLLYYDTQHRRMSEVMLSEIEHREIEDPGSTMDVLRDESYRLAAGFALGYINLGKGRNLHGLRSMQLLERLLNVAIGPRPVELVHVVDKATAGAVIAIALIFMKTGDRSVADKINIPDTVAQIEHVRPDLLLLRTVAKHLIMWEDINDKPGWIKANLPKEFANRYYGLSPGLHTSHMARPHQLKGHDVPFFNIITGLAWSLGLRFAGSGNLVARDEVLALLKTFGAISKQEAYYCDAKLARSTVRRCIDVLALAAATIMAGTGDLETFRYLRSLHGRVDPDTSYGSHMAAHLAIGALFLGGGTYTFGRSNFAVAALICAFYPLFPCEVTDNRVHLQAFRHLWVFAAEPRCMVVKDTDTGRPVRMALRIKLRSGAEKTMTAPCLLPELDSVASITTMDPAYWKVKLDFMVNINHLVNFRRHQTIHVRRSLACESSSNVFSSAFTSLNGDKQGSAALRGIWKWILELSAFEDLDQAVLDLVLPPDMHSAVHLDEHGTVYDTRLVLDKSVKIHRDRDALWNVRMLLEWSRNMQEHGDAHLQWLGKDIMDMLRASITQKMGSIST